jgi:hypothetical protein
MYEIVIKLYISNYSIIQVLLSFVYMIFYSIQWQASHDNWSCYANKPASIWIMQIIKNLHSMTWCYGCTVALPPTVFATYNYTYRSNKL